VFRSLRASARALLQGSSLFAPADNRAERAFVPTGLCSVVRQDFPRTTVNDADVDGRGRRYISLANILTVDESIDRKQRQGL
jgi:hypothetical protein